MLDKITSSKIHQTSKREWELKEATNLKEPKKERTLTENFETSQNITENFLNNHSQALLPKRIRRDHSNPTKIITAASAQIIVFSKLLLVTTDSHIACLIPAFPALLALPLLALPLSMPNFGVSKDVFEIRGSLPPVVLTRRFDRTYKNIFSKNTYY